MHEMKKEYKYKLQKLSNDKDSLYEYNKDVQFKNQQLEAVLSSKTNEIKQYLQKVEN